MTYFKFYKALVSDLIAFLWRKMFQKQVVTILMYHSVDDNGRFSTVSLVEFRYQVKYLHDNGFLVISLNQLISSILNHQSIASKTVVLTFDDGYADNYTVVFPLLKKYNYPATIFLTTSWVGHEVQFNNYTFNTLDWVKIREMQDSGLVDFQSHTHTHPKLTELDSASIKEEMVLSKRNIEENLNKVSNVIAYPFGKFNQTVKNSAKDLFIAALSVEKGHINPATWSRDVYSLPRQSIDSMVSRFRFKLKI